MLLETMLRLLLLGLDNSWGRVFFSSLGNHARPIVMKVIQPLEHVFVSSMGNLASPVVMKVIQQLEQGIC